MIEIWPAFRDRSRSRSRIALRFRDPSRSRASLTSVPLSRERRGRAPGGSQQPAPPPSRPTPNASQLLDRECGGPSVLCGKIRTSRRSMESIVPPPPLEAASPHTSTNSQDVPSRRGAFDVERYRGLAEERHLARNAEGAPGRVDQNPSVRDGLCDRGGGRTARASAAAFPGACSVHSLQGGTRLPTQEASMAMATPLSPESLDELRPRFVKS